jgi:tetratricopeptide (TPR) repeat protein
MLVTERLVLYKIIIILSLFVELKAQNYPDTKVDRILHSGINFLISQDYENAKHEFLLLNNKYPDLPFGKIYSAVTIITEKVDYGTKFNDSFINKYLEEAETQIEKRELKPNNTWDFYFLGLIKGYKAYYYALNDEYLPALSNGISSLNYFEKCINIDSSFKEAYLAIGTYKYWKSEKSEFLSWLPFYSDEREEGIKLLKKGLVGSSYNHYIGINSLVWIYINQGRYSDAIELCNSVLKEYPDSRNFKWCLADAYENVNNKKSIILYNELLASYEKLLNNNHLNEIIIKHILAKLYDKTGQKDLALKQCNEILSIKHLDEYVAERLKDRLKTVKELKMKLLN